MRTTAAPFPWRANVVIEKRRVVTENDAEIVVTENVDIYKENRGTTCGDRNYTEQNVVTEKNSGVISGIAKPVISGIVFSVGAFFVSYE